MSQQSAHVVVTLPDGSELEFDGPVTVEEVAYEIGPGLGRDTVAGRVKPSLDAEGDLVAPEHRIESDVALEIVTEQSDDYLRVLRHSASHVLAQAVGRHYPEAKLAIGPPTDDGFYYDFDDLDVDSEDLDVLRSEMADIVDADYEVEREDVSYEEARERLADEPYKLELLNELEAEGASVSFYRQAEFEDLCAGPHVASTGEIEAVDLLEIAAAYWRGDEANQQLTRIYGTAFESESGLEAFRERREEAAKRDHRKIGRELDLFSIPEVTGPGLPLYHPPGKTVLRELEAFVEALNLDAGYEYVETPHLFKTDLWKKSGHYDNYREDMFLFESGDDEFGLKPMNCPGHTAIFDEHHWSYRDLPVRYAENGKVYRKEQRGELSGLSRVWAFTIDDGHLFVRPDQIEAEVERILSMIDTVLETLDLDYSVALATRPEKSVGSDEIWERAESQLRAVLESGEMAYDLEAGDGAFYGPKIDFAFEDALGRTWDGPTVQLDFNMPERFDLTYVDEHNEEQRPVMIHRALYGSYERFFMVLIEHFAGEFPPWLAPEQVRIIPISEDNRAYAESVAADLDAFRVEIDDRNETLGRRIRDGHDDEVPYMLVLGQDEADAGTVSVRDRQEREASDVPADEFREHLEREVGERRVEAGFLD